jgi:hypothetical protein
MPDNALLRVLAKAVLQLMLHIDPRTGYYSKDEFYKVQKELADEIEAAEEGA